MKLEDQVASLELCKKLKELGVKQDAEFFYMGNKLIRMGTEYRFKEGESTEHVSAFTVAELGEMLPDGFIDKESNYFSILHQMKADFHLWAVTYETSKREVCRAQSETEADARAKMLIYLIENKLVEP